MTDKETEDKTAEAGSPDYNGGELDAAGKSLAEALRVSFLILKLIMAVLVALFITSGIFRVQENEKALVLIFGEIQGTGAEQRILGPGLKWTWPEPISEIIKIPVAKVQTLAIDNFWYFETEEEKLGTRPPIIPPLLNPVKDGYCLTRNESIVATEGADYNFVHAKWELTYEISNLDRFFANISYEPPGPGEDFMDVVSDFVEPMLESLAADTIVTTMVNYTIDEATEHASSIASDVKNLLQAKLDAIDSGITVDDMRASEITWPRQVNAAFELRTLARQKSNTTITEAQSYARKVLTEAGGVMAEEIFAELTTEGISDERKEELLSQLAGASREIIDAARGYRTQVAKDAESNAIYLKELLPEYRKHPKLVLQKIFQDAHKEVLANAYEKIFVQPSTGDKNKLWIRINSDPSLKRTKEKEEENK
jgi:membrane protease subunit HflK